MIRIIEHVQACYEAREVPFGKIYEWHPAYVALECDCGEASILTANSTTIACRCGADFGGFLHDLKEGEDRLSDKLAHPWFHDAQERAQQRLRDDAACPEGSPWRYDDITADDNG